MFGGDGNGRRIAKWRRRVGGQGALVAAPDLPGDMTSTESKMVALWDDHATFTYLVLVAKGAQRPADEIKAYTGRLLANQFHIGYMFLPKFGQDAATEVAKLLQEHIILADKVIDQPTSEERKQAWYKNADDIGAALFGLQSKGGPFLMGRDGWMAEMKEHLDKLTVVVAAYLAGDFVTAVTAIDPYVKHIRHLAMALAKLVSGRLPIPLEFIYPGPVFFAEPPMPRYVYAPRTRPLTPVAPYSPPWLTPAPPPYRFATQTRFY